MYRFYKVLLFNPPDREIIGAHFNHRVLLTLEDFLGVCQHPLFRVQRKTFTGIKPSPTTGHLIFMPVTLVPESSDPVNIRLSFLRIIMCAQSSFPKIVVRL
jgi:hypothetical protein